MNSTIQAKVARGIRKIQSLWGEAMTIGVNQAPLTAIMGRQSLTQRFTEGKGMDEVFTLPVSIAKSDLPQAPFIGQAAGARGMNWKVWLVNPTQTTWELTLESPKK